LSPPQALPFRRGRAQACGGDCSLTPLAAALPGGYASSGRAARPPTAHSCTAPRAAGVPVPWSSGPTGHSPHVPGMRCVPPAPAVRAAESACVGAWGWRGVQGPTRGGLGTACAADEQPRPGAPAGRQTACLLTAALGCQPPWRVRFPPQMERSTVTRAHPILYRSHDLAPTRVPSN